MGHLIIGLANSSCGHPSSESKRARLDVMGSKVTLRPVGAEDLHLLGRFLTDPVAGGEFEWFGYRVPRVKHLERRWHEDGLIGEEESFLAIAIEDGTCIGWVNWRPVDRFGAYEIGISLLPEHRGQGHGTEAQRQLADYLFSTTATHRLEARTETDNIAEQKALERIGFRREGVRRAGAFRDGLWRDGLLYGLLRDDPR
jgi:RimJ/RimL family protein N-acetyltransferase